MPLQTSPAKLLVDFANTYVVDRREAELIGTPRALHEWLVDQGLLQPAADVDADDVEIAHSLRGGLREAMAAHHDGTAAVLPGLDDLAARFPLRISFDRPEPKVVPMGDGVERALGTVLVAAQECAADDTWPRLKLCRAQSCQWAFFDESKNQRRSWCSMAVCGNREKTRAYRQRQHSA